MVTIMANKKLKIGIVGCGGIMRWAHLSAYSKMDNVEIVALCDIVPGRCEDMQSSNSKVIFWKMRNAMLTSMNSSKTPISNPSTSVPPTIYMHLLPSKHLKWENMSFPKNRTLSALRT